MKKVREFKYLFIIKTLSPIPTDYMIQSIRLSVICDSEITANARIINYLCDYLKTIKNLILFENCIITGMKLVEVVKLY